MQRQTDRWSGLDASLVLPAWEPDQSIPWTQSHLQREEGLESEVRREGREGRREGGRR